MELNKDKVNDLMKKVIDEMSKEGISIEAEIKETAIRKKIPSGFYDTVDDAVNAAVSAQAVFILLPLEERNKIIYAIRQTAQDNAQMLGELAVSETGLGKMADKMNKVLLAARKTPGPEDIKPYTFTGDHGLTLIERAPFGVIASITPSTNPPSTIVNNSISILSGGNSVVFNPHPSAKRVTQKAIELIRNAIEMNGGPPDIVTTLKNPSRDDVTKLMSHNKVKLVCVTGGPAIVKMAMTCGKKVIAAGPGNPPVIVDNTADIKKAAKDIVAGASFDNGVLCTAEKEVFACKTIFRNLISEMQKHGAYLLSESETAKLKQLVITKDDGTGFRHPIVNKDWVGKDAVKILNEIGVNPPEGTVLGIFEAAWDDVLVQAEQLMPMLPIVKVDTLEQSIGYAIETEHHFGHTFIMHSKDIANLSKVARLCNASIFVKNGPSYAGLGFNGEGYTTLTIASPTGDGLTRARTFTRERRCSLVDYFRII
ncbi:aldehyde dehydrogenase EutE [Candidatus Dependentiae bacterium]|nr:aldehyde dehydrogenase EutE [Candidatus Dependentiae bacterium]